MTSITRRASALLLSLALTSAPLLADADQRPQLAGRQARINFIDGHVVEGKVQSETRDTIRVGDRVILLAEVATVDLADGDGKSNRAKNGFIIGALAGLAIGTMGALAGSEFAAEANFNPNRPAVGSTLLPGALAVVGSALLFGGIGALIGQATGDSRPHYSKRIIVAGTLVDIAPAATIHSFGVSGKVIW